MLSGALLDAERKIGEFTLKMPKDNSFKGNQWQKPSGGLSPQETQGDDGEKWQNHTDVKFDSAEEAEIKKPSGGPFDPTNRKPKAERIKELGFNRRQVQKFEVLAKNPEVVEQVKREAQENDDIPTRSRVLQLVKEKRSPDWRHEARRGINDAIFKPLNARTDDERLSVWFESLTASDEPQWRLSDIDAAINNLYIIRNYLSRRLREG